MEEEKLNNATQDSKVVPDKPKSPKRVINQGSTPAVKKPPVPKPKIENKENVEQPKQSEKVTQNVPQKEEQVAKTISTKNEVSTDKQNLNDKKLEKELKLSQSKKIKKPNENFYRVFRILGNILFVPFVFIIILTSILMFKAKVRNEVPSLFGNSAVVILSSSMEPNFSKGDVVMVKKVDTNTLQVGDIIAFYEYYEGTEQSQADLNSNSVVLVNANVKTSLGTFLGAGTDNENQQKAAKSYSRVIFHRIVEIDTPTNPADPYYGKKFFKTQGDNNASPDDKWLMEDYVVGIGNVNSKNTFFAKLFQFCASTPGIICFVIIPSLILIVILIIDIYGETRKKKYIEQLEAQNSKQAQIIDEVNGNKEAQQKQEMADKKKQEILDSVMKNELPKDDNTKPDLKPKADLKPKVEPKSPKPESKPKAESKPKVEKAKEPNKLEEENGLKKKRPVWKKDIS